MDRRSFTKSLLGSLIASITGAGRHDDFKQDSFERRSRENGKKNPTPDYDVAIVGGGISGMYTAWRLMTVDPRTVRLPGRSPGDSKILKVALFESSDRIGGRLLSASSPHLPGVKCELGGMRFMSSQERVQRLIRALNLGTHGMETRGNIAYLRGKHIPWTDLSNPDLLPYNLADEENRVVRNEGAGNLIEWAIRSVVNGTSDLYGNKLYRHLQSQRVKGQELYLWGFRQLLAEKLGSDAIELSLALSGFDALGEDANAVDLIMENLDFAPYTKFFLLDDGFEAVPWSLQDRFTEAKGEINYNQQLRHIELLEQGNAGVGLQFASGPLRSARALVLAMPKHPLQKIFKTLHIPSPERTYRLLDSVQSIPLFKAFLLYSRPWWTRLSTHVASDPICVGRSYTDTEDGDNNKHTPAMHIRQCWYWNSVSCDYADHYAMIMVYCDMKNVDFWDPKKAENSEEKLGPSTSPFQKNWQAHKAPKSMIDEMHHQLLILHDAVGEDVPYPIDAAFMNWCGEPYGCAVHFWNKGIKSWEMMDRITHPIEGEVPIYVCGEAYSTNQTWVEGALQTADLVLKHFGLGPLP